MGKSENDVVYKRALAALAKKYPEPFKELLKEEKEKLAEKPARKYLKGEEKERRRLEVLELWAQGMTPWAIWKETGIGYMVVRGMLAASEPEPESEPPTEKEPWEKEWEAWEADKD